MTDTDDYAPHVRWWCRYHRRYGTGATCCTHARTFADHIGSSEQR